MRYFLVALLLVVFGYALALVLQNPAELPVDLLFTQVPAMRFRVIATINFSAWDCSWIVAWCTGFPCIPKRMGS